MSKSLIYSTVSILICAAAIFSPMPAHAGLFDSIGELFDSSVKSATEGAKAHVDKKLNPNKNTQNNENPAEQQNSKADNTASSEEPAKSVKQQPTDSPEIPAGSLILRSKTGSVKYSHADHGKSISNCKICHAKKPGPINVASSKDFFHKKCKGCHDSMGQGPVKCGECHRK